MIKRWNVLSLMLLAVLLFVSACSGGVAQTGVDSGEAVQSENNTKADKTIQEDEAAKSAVDVPDLGGRVIKVAAWWDLKPAGETASDKARLDKIAEVEKKYKSAYHAELEQFTIAE